MKRFNTTQEMVDATLYDALVEARIATGPDQHLDNLIWFKVIFDQTASEDRMGVMGSTPSYTRYLDHAKLLYLDLPDRIPSDPLRVVVEALEQRLA